MELFITMQPSLNGNLKNEKSVIGLELTETRKELARRIRDLQSINLTEVP